MTYVFPSNYFDGYSDGDQIVDGTTKWWFLHTKNNFDAADLTAIAGDATIEWEWETLDPRTSKKPGLMIVKSASATFEADAGADSGVYDVYADRYFSPFTGVAANAELFNSITNPFDPPIPPLPYNDDIMWPHKAIDLAGAEERNVTGRGIRVGTFDAFGGSISSDWLYRKAIAEGLGNAPVGNVRAGPLDMTGATGKTINITLDGGAPLSEYTFGTISTNADVVTELAAHFTSEGADAFADIIVSDLGSAGNQWLIIGSNTVGPTAKVEIVSGTALDDLGYNPGQKGRIGDYVGNSDISWVENVIRLEYMKPKFPGTGFKASNYDLDLAQPMYQEISPYQPSETLIVETDAESVFRDDGITSAAATREFTIQGTGISGVIPAAITHWAYTGVQVGDALVVEDGTDAGTYTISEVLYNEPGVNNRSTKVKIDQDWPAGGQTGITFHIIPVDRKMAFYDMSQHLTYTQGCIVGGEGVGIAPDVTLVGGGGFGSFLSTARILRAMEGLANSNLDIVNMSIFVFGFAGVGWSSVLFFLLKKAVEQLTKSNILVVVSAGNDGLDMNSFYPQLKHWPADVGKVLVASGTGPFGYDYTDPDAPGVNLDSSMIFTSFGSGYVDLAAPGGNLPLFLPQSKRLSSNYFCLSGRRAKFVTEDEAIAAGDVGNTITGVVGTSLSAPCITSVAALALEALRSGRPEATKVRPADSNVIASILRQTADDRVGDPGLDTPGYDAHYGHGRVNARKAVNKALL